MYAGHGPHPEQKINDLIRAVTHEDTGRLNPQASGQRRRQPGIARLRIAVNVLDVVLQHCLHHRRRAQRVFVAGHLDDALKAVTPLNLLNAQAGLVRLERRNFRTHVVGRGKGHGHAHLPG